MRCLLFATLVACGNSKAPPQCGAVGAKLVILAQADLERVRVDDTTRRMVLAQLPAMRDKLVNACKDSDWDPQVRTCMVDATDHASFAKCEEALSTAQRDALQRATPSE